MRGRVAVQARKRLAAERAAQRLASGLAAMCRTARRGILDEFPDQPHPLQSYQLADRAATVVTLLQLGLRSTLTRGLTALGSWSHLRTARLLTQWTRGTLAVRKPKREDWLDDLLGTADQYARLLIDPPSADLLRRIVGPAPDRLTRLVDPQDASRVVLDGISRGQDRRQIGKELETLFGGWESAARRVARTAGLQAATEMQLAASEEIPGLVIGYQILAVLDSRTRPEHRKRSGTVYYRNPRPGQKGMKEMPRPPIEPDGTISWNCRCFCSPVLPTDTPDDLSLAGSLTFDPVAGRLA
jgi:SPP1 gp7 family putative phage head morphogenesis protein